MILIDSSVWLEYLSAGPRVKKIEKYFKPANKIVMPSIVLHEVYKKIKSEHGESEAIFVTAQMERLSCNIVAIDQPLAVQAADLSIQYKLPMADALIYSVALIMGATVITLDTHFKNLPAAEYIK